MPIWLRNFTFQKINEWYEKQNEEAEKASKKGGSGKMPKGPNIKKPSYSTKARS